MESIIRDEIMARLSESGLLHEAQYGFRPRRSCVTQLLSTLYNLSKMTENGDPIDAVYLDFSKAFDSVPHRHLIKKLQLYRVTGRLLSWIRAFLTGRRQRVMVNGCRSDRVPVASGVQQGSVLGPLLLVLYVNNLPTAVQCPIQLFADDTKLYQSVRPDSDASSLQRDLDMVVTWSNNWRLPFNEAKCSTHFECQERVLHARCGEERDLGVLVDPELKFREQAASAVSKATQILAVIRRSFQLIDRTTLHTPLQDSGSSTPRVRQHDLGTIQPG